MLPSLKSTLLISSFLFLTPNWSFLETPNLYSFAEVPAFHCATGTCLLCFLSQSYEIEEFSQLRQQMRLTFNEAIASFVSEDDGISFKLNKDYKIVSLRINPAKYSGELPLALSKEATAQQLIDGLDFRKQAADSDLGDILGSTYVGHMHDFFKVSANYSTGGSFDRITYELLPVATFSAKCFSGSYKSDLASNESARRAFYFMNNLNKILLGGPDGFEENKSITLDDYNAEYQSGALTFTAGKFTASEEDKALEQFGFYAQVLNNMKFSCCFLEAEEDNTEDEGLWLVTHISSGKLMSVSLSLAMLDENHSTIQIGIR